MGLLGIVSGWRRESAGFPDCSLKRSAQDCCDFSDRSSTLGQWISDDEINNDANSLYVEIIDKNRTCTTNAKFVA